MLSDAERTALLVHVHRELEEAATRLASGVAQAGSAPTLVYPPNHGYSGEEQPALEEVSLSGAAEAAVRKATASAIAEVLYGLFAVIDGVADPLPELEGWGVYAIGPADDNDDLHNKFFATYWEWRARRPDVGWKLDMHEGPIRHLGQGPHA
jgi:hypothetical protein